MMSELEWKRAAAAEALKYVDDGMALGLGTGSTAAEFVTLIGERVRNGLQIICVPTSEATRQQAEGLGIPLTTLDETPTLDLTVDGADEIDRELRLIKGGGGALLREKIVAMASERVVIIADHSKRVDVLGRFPLPIEVVQFGLTSTYQLIEELSADCGCEGEIRQRLRDDGSAYVTDNGNFILDCAFGAIENPESLEDALRMVPGMIESGLFVGVADLGIVAGPEGLEVLALEEKFPGEGPS